MLDDGGLDLGRGEDRAPLALDDAHVGLAALGDLAQQVAEASEDGTSTTSPGSISETKAASMPARLVPSTSRVASFFVRKTPR